MLKLLRVNYGDNFTYNKIGVLSAVAHEGESEVYISTDSGLSPLPISIMIGNHLSDETEIISITEINTVGSDIVATCATPLKNSYSSSTNFYTVSDSTFTVFRDYDTSDAYEQNIAIDSTLPYLEYVLDTDTHNEEIAFQLDQSLTVLSSDESTTTAPDMYIDAQEFRSYIPDDVSDNLTDSQVRTLIVNATGLIQNHMGFSVSYQTLLEEYATSLSSSTNDSYQTTTLTSVRPVIEIIENPTALFINGTEAEIDLEDIKIRKGCPLFYNEIVTSVSIVDQNVSARNNTITEMTINYTGGLKRVPAEIVSALGMYATAIYQSKTSFDALGAGIKKQKHYNREIQYNTANDSSHFNALLHSPTVKSANAILNSITNKYGGF